MTQYVKASQGIGQSNTNMFRISQENPRITFFSSNLKNKDVSADASCNNCRSSLSFTSFHINKTDCVLVNLKFQN